MGHLLVLTITSFLWTVCLGDCTYNALYESDIDLHGDPGTVFKKPFGLVLAVNEHSVRTEQACVDFCNSKKWCVATDDLSDINVPEYCLFITDRQLLELDSSGACNNQFNKLNCDFDKDTLISLDNDVFRVLDSSLFGAKSSDHIFPSNLVEQSAGAGKFCRILKTDDQMISVRGVSYSDFFASPPIIYKGWVDYTAQSYETPKDMGDPNLYAKQVSVPHGGYPINAMSIVNFKPYQNARPNDEYRMFRFKFVDQKECKVSAPVSHTYISPAERSDGDTFFHFITTLNDDSSPRYLSCNHTTDDNAFACEWATAPTMVWKMGTWENENSFNWGGHKKGFMAYDINDLGTELGWLDRSHCDSDLGSNLDQLRILHGGKKNGNFHCGTNHWRLGRGDSNSKKFKGGAEIGTGSFLTFSNDNEVNGALVVAHVRGQNSVDPQSARLCGDVRSAFSSHSSCGGSVTRTKTFRVESFVKNNDTDTLFSIEDGTKALHCPRSGTSCIWKTKGQGHPTHYFKFINHGIGNSVVSPQSITTHQHNNILIYENIEGFLTQIGYLAPGNDPQHLGLTLNPDNTTTNMEIDPINGIVSNSKKIIGGDNNEVATFAAPAQDDRNGKTVVMNVTTITEDERYHWLIDVHESLDDNGMMMCPDGEYMHQIRCKTDQRCEHVDMACVKATNDNCGIHNLTNTTYELLLENQFVECSEDDGVIVGWNYTHIACKSLVVTPQQPTGHTPRVFSPIGFMTENTTKATFVDQPSERHWPGRPYQAIRPTKHYHDMWIYGEKCLVEYDNSNFKVNGLNSVQQVNLKGKYVRCNDDNEFISHVSCLQQDDCRRGLKVTCDAAPSCEMTGEVTKIRQDTGLVGGVCPFGTVIKGIKCLSSLSSDNVDIPCTELELECAKINYNPGFDPGRPSAPITDNTDTTKTILISLGVGLPLIVVGAIVCLCCLPDNVIMAPQDVPVQENSMIRDYEAVTTIETTNNTNLRHRTMSKF